MELGISPIFLKNFDATARMVVNQGGTRSGKTYSILQVLIIKYCLNKHTRRRGIIIDIVRKTQTELRATVLVDFIDILTALGIYNPRSHNKTNMEYRLNGNLFRFIGLDKAQKKRGSKRHILYINEANGLTLEDWIQLSIRCEDQIYIDYNPSEYFWVNEQILEKRSDKYELILSTYLDNYDFLTKEQIDDIENLINIDDFYYKVYVLGILAIMKGKIYNNYNLIEPEDYDNIYEDEKFYGLDFGYEHATSLMEVKYAGEQVYEREIYHESHKLDDDLLLWLDENHISTTATIYADPAMPSSIRKLRDAGYQVVKAKKDVRDGIRFCQSLKRNICKSSVHYIKSINRYKFKQTPDGAVIEEPVKRDDDPCDAMRYAEFTHLRKRLNQMGV